MELLIDRKQASKTGTHRVKHHTLARRGTSLRACPSGLTREDQPDHSLEVEQYDGCTASFVRGLP